MWWSRAPLSKALLLAAALAVAGPAACGFRPLYAPGAVASADPVTSQLAQVRVHGILDRQGQELRNALLARMNPGGEPAAPRYLLSVKLTRSEAGLGYRRDTYATLAEIRYQAAFTLTDEDEGLTSSNHDTAVVSFDYLGARYASIAMERDAESRALNELADRITHRVAMLVGGQAKWRRPGERETE